MKQIIFNLLLIFICITVYVSLESTKEDVKSLRDEIHRINDEIQLQPFNIE